MAPYSRRAGSSSAAMTCGPAGPCFGGDRSEGRGRGPQVRARPKLLAEVEARGLGRGFAEGGDWRWWLAPSQLFPPSLGSRAGLVSWSCFSRTAASNRVV